MEMFTQSSQTKMALPQQNSSGIPSVGTYRLTLIQ